MPRSRLRWALSRSIKVGVVFLAIVIIVLGGYLSQAKIPTRPMTETTTSGTTTNSGPGTVVIGTNYTEASTTSSAGGAPQNASQFVDEAIGLGAYDSLDPSFGFFPEDGGFFMNVFQGLLTNPFNGSSIDPTEVVPALASSYSVGGGSPICVAPSAMRGGSSNCIPSPSNYTQYDFAMRNDTKFSNGDPVDAYVAWFSFVRVLWYNAVTTIGISNYAGLTVNETTDEPCYNGTIVSGGCGENIWPDGLENALLDSGSLRGVNPATPAGQNELVSALNQMLSNYDPAKNATQAAIVGYPDQAYVASNASSFTINLVEPYRLFPLALTEQWAAVQDPKFIDQNGGLENNTGLACASSQCMGFNNNGMPGTGPYEYNCPSRCPADHSQLELVKNPNYWASGVSGLNSALQPATIGTIVMKFGLQTNTLMSDFSSNQAQVISVPYNLLSQSWSSFHSNYPQYSFDQVFSDQGAPLCDTAIEINTRVSSNFETYTGNDSNPGTIAASTLVRQAIVHAVNYTEFQKQLFAYNGTSLGKLFLPPVPPGYGPLDNPDNVPLYSYNITLAAMDLNQAGKVLGFYTVLPRPMTINGTVFTDLGDNTTGNLFSAIPFEIMAPLTPETQTEWNITNSGLQRIGLTLALPSEGYTCGYSSCEASPETTPPMLIDEWCGDWADPIYQQFYDMGTSAVKQYSWPDNGTLNALLSKIPFETNSTQQLQQTKLAYQIFTQMATMIQLPNGIDNGGAFMIQPYVQNLHYSFAQFGFAYNMAIYS